jgi:hypothetical protein
MELSCCHPNLTNQEVTLYDFSPGNGQKYQGLALELDNGPAYGEQNFHHPLAYLYHDLSDAFGPSGYSLMGVLFNMTYAT